MSRKRKLRTEMDSEEDLSESELTDYLSSLKISRTNANDNGATTSTEDTDLKEEVSIAPRPSPVASMTLKHSQDDEVSTTFKDSEDSTLSGQKEKGLYLKNPLDSRKMKMDFPTENLQNPELDDDTKMMDDFTEDEDVKFVQQLKIVRDFFSRRMATVLKVKIEKMEDDVKTIDSSTNQSKMKEALEDSTTKADEAYITELTDSTSPLKESEGNEVSEQEDSPCVAQKDKDLSPETAKASDKDLEEPIEKKKDVEYEESTEMKEAEENENQESSRKSGVSRKRCLEAEVVQRGVMEYLVNMKKRKRNETDSESENTIEEEPLRLVLPILGSSLDETGGESSTELCHNTIETINELANDIPDKEIAQSPHQPLNVNIEVEESKSSERLQASSHNLLSQEFTRSSDKVQKSLEDSVISFKDVLESKTKNEELKDEFYQLTQVEKDEDVDEDSEVSKMLTELLTVLESEDKEIDLAAISSDLACLEKTESDFFQKSDEVSDFLKMKYMEEMIDKVKDSPIEKEELDFLSTGEYLVPRSEGNEMLSTRESIDKEVSDLIELCKNVSQIGEADNLLQAPNQLKEIEAETDKQLSSNPPISSMETEKPETLKKELETDAEVPSENEFLRKKSDKVTADIVHIRKQMEMLRSYISFLANQKRETERKEKQASKEMECLQSENSRLSTDLELARQTIQHLEQKVKKDETKAIKEKKVKAGRVPSTDVGELRLENKSLRGYVIKLRKKREEIVEEYEKKKEENQAMKSQLEILEQNKGTQEKELKERYSNLQREMNELGVKIASVEKENQQLKEQLQQFVKDSADNYQISKMMEALRLHITVLKFQYCKNLLSFLRGNANIDISMEMNGNQSVEEIIQRCEAQKIKATEEAKSSRSLSTSSRSHPESTDALPSTALQTYDSTVMNQSEESEVTMLRRTLADLEADYKEVQKRNGELKEKTERYKTCCAALKKACQKKTEKVSELKEVNKNLTIQINSLLEENKNLDNNCTRLDKDYLYLKCDFRDLKREHEKLKQQFENAKVGKSERHGLSSPKKGLED